MYNDVLIERNQFKQQCTQGKLPLQNVNLEFPLNFPFASPAIRQWDQALREKTEYKDALTKVSRN